MEWNPNAPASGGGVELGGAPDQAPGTKSMSRMTRSALVWFQAAWVTRSSKIKARPACQGQGKNGVIQGCFEKHP
jgi:hypothetical protein